MQQSHFSKEVIEQLRSNPHVERVTDKTIFFTQEFKTLAAQSILFSKSLRETNDDISHLLVKIGIDPKLLGPGRIGSIRIIAKKIISEASEPETNKLPARNSNDARKIKCLEHEVAYLKQEQEFIKKILAESSKNDK